MPHTCISDAITLLQELHSCLDDAYWEASDMDAKDRFYGLISALNHELSELGKLSVQDHNLAYEVITSEFRMVTGKLGALEKSLDESVLRVRTALRLADCLKAVRKLVG